MHATLAIMTADGWRPGFGDNDPEGWAITVAYFVAAGLCAGAWRGERGLGRRDARGARPIVWAGLMGLLVALGLNKQLDLQHWLIFAVRDRLAQDPSLWAKRYAIGAAAGACAAVCGLGGAYTVMRYVGTAFRRYAVAFAGSAALGAFVFIRAGSFLPLLNKLNANHLEALHLAMELGSILTIGVGASHAIASLRVRRRAARQDLLAATGGLRLVDRAPLPLPADLQPAARRAA